MQPVLQQRLTQKTVQFHTQYQQKALHFLTSGNHALAAELAQLVDRNPLLHVKWMVDVNQMQLDLASNPQSILDDLRYQLRTLKQKHNRVICEYIIETLDDHGFLSYSITDYCEQLHVTEELFLRQLAIVQQFDPFGIASKNSMDFILKQLQQKQDFVSIAILSDHSDHIIKKAWNSIASQLQITVHDVQCAMQRIKTCALYPCEISSSPAASYIVPDLLVTVNDFGLQIEPYQFAQVETTPYTNEMSDEWKAYFKESKLFIDAFHHRNQTLLRVSNELFKRQESYFLDQQPLLPCRLADISEATKLHISTVSRTIQGKYYEYQGRLIPLKTLLTHRSIQDKSKFEISTLLVSYINAENPHYPYSDLELQQRFEQDGILLSRRVISKYRKELKIPSSYKRRIPFA